jgi:hypothetical protein
MSEELHFGQDLTILDRFLFFSLVIFGHVTAVCICKELFSKAGCRLKKPEVFRHVGFSLEVKSSKMQREENQSRLRES